MQKKMQTKVKNVLWLRQYSFLEPRKHKAHIYLKRRPEIWIYKFWNYYFSICVLKTGMKNWTISPLACTLAQSSNEKRVFRFKKMSLFFAQHWSLLHAKNRSGMPHKKKVVSRAHRTHQNRCRVVQKNPLKASLVAARWAWWRGQQRKGTWPKAGSLPSLSLPSGVFSIIFHLHEK